MPTELTGPDSRGKSQNEMGLYDRFAEGEPEVVASKVLDITDVVPGKATQAVIKFASDTNGPIVQFQDRYRSGEDMGTSTHFHIDEKLASKLGDYFVTSAWGFSPEDLVRIVAENSPQE